jgi:hypothetical protein
MGGGRVAGEEQDPDVGDGERADSHDRRHGKRDGSAPALTEQSSRQEFARAYPIHRHSPPTESAKNRGDLDCPPARSSTDHPEHSSGRYLFVIKAMAGELACQCGQLGLHPYRPAQETENRRIPARDLLVHGIANSKIA